MGKHTCRMNGIINRINDDESMKNFTKLMEWNHCKRESYLEEARLSEAKTTN